MSKEPVVEDTSLSALMLLDEVVGAVTPAANAVTEIPHKPAAINALNKG